MTTLTQTQSTLLQNAVRGNAIFSTACAVIAIVSASAIADYLGAGVPLFYSVLGAILLGHAGILFYSARGNQVASSFAWYAIIGDVAWVIATAYILLTDSFNLTTGGKWLVLGIGDIVLCFAIAQYIGLRRQNR